jgi:hypothetical protein
MTEIYDNGTEVNNIDKNYYDFMLFSRFLSGKYPFNIASESYNYNNLCHIEGCTVLYSTYPIPIYGILLMFLLRALETPFEAINLLNLLIKSPICSLSAQSHL